MSEVPLYPISTPPRRAEEEEDRKTVLRKGAATPLQGGRDLLRQTDQRRERWVFLGSATPPHEISSLLIGLVFKAHRLARSLSAARI